MERLAVFERLKDATPTPACHLIGHLIQHLVLLSDRQGLRYTKPCIDSINCLSIPKGWPSFLYNAWLCVALFFSFFLALFMMADKALKEQKLFRLGTLEHLTERISFSTLCRYWPTLSLKRHIDDYFCPIQSEESVS